MPRDHRIYFGCEESCDQACLQLVLSADPTTLQDRSPVSKVRAVATNRSHCRNGSWASQLPVIGCMLTSAVGPHSNSCFYDVGLDPPGSLLELHWDCPRVAVIPVSI